MVQKPSETKIRKLPLPLQIKLGNDTIVTDGLFSLTSKEASQIKIISIDEDNYVSCEIFPPQPMKLSSKSLTEIFGKDQDTPIGTELSKSRGRAKEFGQYKYFKKPDGNLYVVISGARPHTHQLGNIIDKNSSISIVARCIKQNFNSNEFSKNELAGKLPKRISYGQILKSILDVMKLEGYLEKREMTPKGRLHEKFKATDKMYKILVATASPEQA